MTIACPTTMIIIIHKLQLGRLWTNKSSHLIWFDVHTTNARTTLNNSNTVCKHIIVYVIRCLPTFLPHTWVSAQRVPISIKLWQQQPEMQQQQQKRQSHIYTMRIVWDGDKRTRTIIMTMLFLYAVHYQCNLDFVQCSHSHSDQKRMTINANAKTLKLLEEEKTFDRETESYRERNKK